VRCNGDILCYEANKISMDHSSLNILTEELHRGGMVAEGSADIRFLFVDGMAWIIVHTANDNTRMMGNIRRLRESG
jgi:hypothetical protein